MVSPGSMQRDHGGRVGLGAGVRLHVGGLGAEQGLHPVDGELLDDVDVLAAAVVAPAGVALGVLVGQDRALGLHHGERGEVLATRSSRACPAGGPARRRARQRPRGRAARAGRQAPRWRVPGVQSWSRSFERVVWCIQNATRCSCQHQRGEIVAKWPLTCRPAASYRRTDAFSLHLKQLSPARRAAVLRPLVYRRSADTERNPHHEPRTTQGHPQRREGPADLLRRRSSSAGSPACASTWPTTASTRCCSPATTTSTTTRTSCTPRSGGTTASS